MGTMRAMRAAVLAAGGLVAGAMTADAATGTVAADAPAVLEPSDKWNVDYGANGCLLVRPYGTGKGRVLLGWRALPLGETMQLLAVRRSSDAELRRGVIDLSLDPGTADAVTFEEFPGKDGQRFMQARVGAAQFARLPDRTVLTVRPSHGKPFAVALTNARRAFEALATCNDEIARQWGIDPAERQRIAVPAVGQGDDHWITENDYPAAAIMRGSIGSTTMLWAVDPAGRVTDCRVVIRSGTDALDEAACAALTKRGRYTPAIGHDGKPMVSHMSRVVVWMMPGAWHDDPAYIAMKRREQREQRERATNRAQDRAPDRSAGAN